MMKMRQKQMLIPIIQQLQIIKNLLTIKMIIIVIQTKMKLEIQIDHVTQ